VTLLQHIFPAYRNTIITPNLEWGKQGSSLNKKVTESYNKVS